MKPHAADPRIVIDSDAMEASSFSQLPIQPAVNDAAWEGARSGLRKVITRFVGWVRSLGPYAAIELILPGGSIIAVALWTYRHRRALRRSPTAPQTVAAPIMLPATLTCVRRCNGR
jgi:hypothetical protein